MSSTKKPPTESANNFITRKYLEYRKLLDEALEAGALMTPNMSEQLEANKVQPNNYVSTIKITFVISELQLHEFRKNKTGGL